MDISEPHTAADWLNTASEAELAAAWRGLADEPKARRLAREIVKRRATEPFATSDQLVGAIRTALGGHTGPSDFARIFQAARITINRELDGLAVALPALRDRMAPGGRLAVITYHSGEDRLVKHAFREWSRACTCPPRLPTCVCGGVAAGSLRTRKAVTASEAELSANVRARSARLRVWQRAA
jgi:16S rRNA (cytosine1402-N4)-methyltransferase